LDRAAEKLMNNSPPEFRAEDWNDSERQAAEEVVTKSLKLFNVSQGT